MTTEEPTTPPADADRYAVATRGDSVRLPSWMSGQDATEPLTRGERARLAWARHRGKLLVGFVILLLLALVTGTVVLGRLTVDRIRTGTQPSASPVPSSQIGEPRDLFAEGPAADFAVGEAAIVLPPVAAAEPFSAAEVRAALTQVRKALVEARIDLSMQLGDPEPFLALLAPATRGERARDFEDYTFLHYATRIDSRGPRSDEVRAKGAMSYRATTNDEGIQVLEITTEYVWVYAFDIPRTTPDGAGLAAIRDKVVWQVPQAASVPATERGLWLTSAEAGTSNVECSRLTEGYLTVQPWMGGPGSFKPC
ncbi:hypothetical protein [Micromonospora sp. SL4-19]|uniref:hypothetical protein n=1 Tax=Micromonospora sp. SL4-19 TaxID=3399129 RepID=UPI003A4E0788